MQRELRVPGFRQTNSTHVMTVTGGVTDLVVLVAQGLDGVSVTWPRRVEQTKGEVGVATQQVTDDHRGYDARANVVVGVSAVDGKRS